MDLSRNSGATVLVVDDQEIVKSLICRTLESSGFRVLSANNGADALALCREAEPPVDLLVTDYSMPGMTGVELAHECCSFRGELRVLYVSGSSPGEDLREDLAQGRRGFLAKPFRQSDLLLNAKAVLAMDSAREAHSYRAEQCGAERRS